MNAHTILRAGLNKLLKHWVESYKEEHLDFGILNGSITLRDLVLRKELLENAKVPLALKRGTIGRLHIKLGFASLTSASLCVEVDDVDIVLTPVSAKELLVKEFLYARMIAQSTATTTTTPENEDDFSALFAIAVKLTRDITVNIRNVQIHYEDALTIPRAPILIGASVDLITSHTKDGWFKGRAIYQTVHVTGFALFMNTDWRVPSQASEQSEEQAAAQLRALYEAPRHHIVYPTQLHAKVFYCPNQANVPPLLVSMHQPELRVTLEQDQYSAVLALGELVRGFSRRAAHKLQRPTVPVKRNARVWWRFVVQSVREDVRAARRQLWMRALSRKRRERELYIMLVRRHQGGRSEAGDAMEMQALEARFDPTDLQELRVAATRFTDAHVHMQTAPRSQFTSSEIEALQNELGVTFSRHRTEQLFVYTSDAFTFMLKGEKDNSPLLGVVVESVGLGYTVHQVEWRTLHFSASSFAIADYYSAPGQTVATVSPRPRDSEGAFMDLQYEIHPLDKHEDFMLNLHLDLLDVVFSRNLVEAIVRFFLSPRYAPILELSDKARETLSAIEQSVENRIRFALMYHEIIAVNFLIEPPRIFFPAAFGRAASAVVAELGAITVVSDLRPRGAVRAINIENLPASGEGSELVYDAYSVTLDVQNMYLVSVDDSNESATAPCIRKAIDSFSTCITLHILNIDVPRLPFVKLTGSLPVIGVYVRREDLKQFASVAGELLFSDTSVSPSPAAQPTARFTPEQSLQKQEGASQLSFRMDMSVDTVFLKIYSHPLGKEAQPHDLFLATWKGFAMTLKISNDATEVNTSLRAFYIEDLRPAPGSNVLRYLLRSQPYQQMDDLISLNYLGISRNAPFYNNVDSVLEINVAGLSIRVTPASLSLMLQLVDDTAAAFIAKSNEKTRNALHITASSEEVNHVREAPHKSSLVQLTASFGMCEVLLDSGVTRIASAALSNNRMFVELHSDSSISAEAKLGGLEVVNYDPSVPAWREVVRMEKRESTFIELKYSTISPPRDGYEASLVAVVNNVTVVALSSFFTKIQALLTSMLQTIQPSVLPLPEFSTSTEQKPWLDYRVLLQNPLVIVPRNGSSQEEFIQLDLGRIYVYTTPVPEQAASLLSVEVEDFNVRTMLPGLMAPIPLLKNTALLLRLMQSSDTSRSVDPTVRSEVPSLQMSVSPLQLALVLNVLNENVLPAAQVVPANSSSSSSSATSNARASRASFRLLHLTVDLQTHPGGLPWDTQPLASLSVGQVLAEFHHVPNEFTKIEATIRMAALEDARPSNRTRLRTLLTSRALHQDALLLRIIAPSNSTPPELYATISSLHLCVLPEPLQELLAFMQHCISLINQAKKPGQPSLPPSSPPPPPPPAAASFPPFEGRLRLSVQDTHIALPAIRAPTEESVGVVVEAQTNFFVECTKEASQLELQVQSLTARRSGIMGTEPSATILRPFSLSVQAGFSANDGEVTGKAEIGELSVLLTASDVILLQRVQENLMLLIPPSTEPDSSLLVSPPSSTPTLPVQLLTQFGARQASMVVHMNSGLLTIVEDCIVCPLLQKSVSQPLARLSWHGLEGTLKLPPLRADLTLVVAIGYWNARQTVWEPFLEDWRVGLQLVQNAKVWPPPQELSDPERQLTVPRPVSVSRFQLQGLSALEFTVSRAMINSANRFLTTCKAEFARAAEAARVHSQAEVMAAPQRPYHPWVVLNCTGAPLACTVLQGEEMEQSPRLLMVQEEGALIALEKAVYTRSQIGDTSAQGVESMSLAVKLPTGEEIGSLPFGRCCLFAVPLTNNRTFVYEIVYEGGKNVVRLRSNLLLHNRTRRDLFLRILRPNGQVAHEYRVKAGEKYGAPLQVVADALISIAPAEASYALSLPSIDVNQPPATPQLISCAAALQDHSPFSCIARVSVSKLTHQLGSTNDYRITISPPLVLLNLLCAPLSFRLSRARSPSHVEATLQPGEKYFFHEADFTHSVWISMKLPGYQWSAPSPLSKAKPAADSILLTSEGTAPHLHVHLENRTRKQGHRKLVCFTPYWIVNETSLELQYSHSSHALEMALALNGSESQEANRSGVAPPRDPSRSRPIGWSSSQLSMRVAGGAWSAPHPISRLHHEDYPFTIPPSPNQHQWNLLLSQSQPPRKFWRSTVLNLRFAYVLVNDSQEALSFKQAFTEQLLILAPGEVSSWHWRDSTAPQQLCVTKAGRGDTLSWSSPFSLDITKTAFDLNLWTVANTKEMVRVQMRRNNGSTVLVFRARPEFSQFRIENRCKGLNLVVRQKGSRDEQVLAGAETSFAWTNPDAPVKEQLLDLFVSRGSDPPTFIGHYGFHKFKKWNNVPVAALRGTLTVEVLPAGPTRVLVVSDSRSREPPLAWSGQELEGCVELPSLGISVVDEAPQELCYISLRRISLDLLRTAIDKSVDLRVGSVQVDNSLPATAFPVLLAIQPPVDKEPLPAVHVSLCKGSAYSEMSYYRYLGFAVQPCTIKFDELFVLASVNFASAMYDLASESWRSQDFEQYANSSAKLVDPQCLTRRRIFFDLLEIQSLRVQVNFLTLPHLSAGNAASEQSLWIERLLSRVGLLANVDGELLLRALILERAYGPRSVVFGLVAEHFQRQAYRQWLRLIGASVLLGAPTVFWTSIAHGFRDLVAEPAKSRKSASGLAGGVGRGARSLGQHTVYGFANSASLMTSNIARALGKASFDAHYQTNRELAQVLQRPVDPCQGLVAGSTAFSKSIAAAARGLVDLPRAQMRRKGRMKPVRVIGAVGAGLLGLVVKPLAGAFDMVSLCSEGVKNVTVPFVANSSDVRKRIRPPRHFDETHALLPYNLVDAAAQYLLRSAKEGKFMKEVYLYGQPIAELQWLVLSVGLLLLIALHKDGTVKKVKGINADSIREIRSDGNNLVVLFQPSAAPNVPKTLRLRVLAPPPRSTVSQFEAPLDDSASSLSDVMPRVSADSEWIIRSAQPMQEIAEAFQERLKQFREERAPLCPPPSVAIEWAKAQTKDDVVREEVAMAQLTEQQRAMQRRQEKVAFENVAARCQEERVELQKLMTQQRRAPLAKDTTSPQPTEVLSNNRKAERKYKLEQSLVALQRQEQHLTHLIEKQQAEVTYQTASFSDFGTLIGVNMKGVQRVDAAPVERLNQPNLLRFQGRPLAELRASLLQVKSKIAAVQQALKQMEYHSISRSMHSDKIANAVLEHVKQGSRVWRGLRYLGRRAATVSPVLAFWLIVILIYICWKANVWFV